MITILMNLWAAGADFTRARFVRANASELNLRESWITPLGVLKAAGAVGLLCGLLGVPLVGDAAAVGLVLFFAGALFVHVRARVFHNIAAPAAFFVMAVACLVMAVGT
ncbi:DoxX family protein [Actinophytocola sp.]|uniref:DoxX family protein n=1 Tax=Actinophytocola sp. TaxID=1872138 RepID=UPI002ED07ECB